MENHVAGCEEGGFSVSRYIFQSVTNRRTDFKLVQYDRLTIAGLLVKHEFEHSKLEEQETLSFLVPGTELRVIP